MGKKLIVLWIQILILCDPRLALGQDALLETYEPNIEVEREVPSELRTSLWLGVYVAGIYGLSRLESNTTLLGGFYLVPAFYPFYKQNSERTSWKEGLSQDSVALGSLSFYNFFQVPSEKRTKSEVFRENIYANVFVWSSLAIYRWYFGKRQLKVLPLLGKNTGGIYLESNF